MALGPETLFNTPFPYPDVAAKTALAAGIGLLVGLEREWAQKEIGVRTFAITGLLGMLSSLFVPSLVMIGVIAVLVLISFLNVHSLLRDRSLELTTSVCLIVTFILGALVGGGHYFTAATSAIVMMLLLSWKPELERFAGALKPAEIRGAVLLGLLSVVVYPLLPDRFVDPWRLINPRESWVIVVVIAGIGFANYVLLRIYSTRGLYYSAVLGGLVNSTAAAAELAALFSGSDAPADTAVAVLLLTNVAMFLRNLVILAIFAGRAVAAAAPPLGVMALLTMVFTWRARPTEEAPGEVQLSSPVSLRRVIKFAILFLLLQVVGTIAQRVFGSLGFLVVSLLGGLISSASATATAASLAAAGKIGSSTAGIGAVLASMASAIMTVPLVRRQARAPRLVRRMTFASLLIVAAGTVVLIAVELATRAY